MAKSRIIRELANGEVDTQTALKRTKVLLQDLNNQELLDWVNNEIGGYPDDAKIPEYRIISGQLFGSYIKGSMASYMQYTNVPLPLGNMPDDLKDAFLKTKITTSIGALANMIQNDKDEVGLSKVIPADFYANIAHYNNDPYMIINFAQVKLNTSQIRDIFPKIESMLLDVLAYLEKNFGVLDSLDIDVDSKSEEEIDEIIKHLILVIYNDNSVNIGDNNKIKGSEIASSIEENS